jgi:hypothetical protein
MKRVAIAFPGRLPRPFCLTKASPCGLPINGPASGVRQTSVTGIRPVACGDSLRSMDPFNPELSLMAVRCWVLLGRLTPTGQRFTLAGAARNRSASPLSGRGTRG